MIRTSVRLADPDIGKPKGRMPPDPDAQSIGVATFGYPSLGERCHMMLAPFPGDPPEQCDRDAEFLDAEDGLPYCGPHTDMRWEPTAS